jgi:hypothetical protein
MWDGGVMHCSRGGAAMTCWQWAGKKEEKSLSLVD